MQAQAILDLRLQRLTGLEQDRITGDYREVMDAHHRSRSTSSRAPSASRARSSATSSVAIRNQFGDERRSEIVAQGVDLSLEDLIAPQEMVVTLSHGGYMKAQPVGEYRAQRRGGRGKQATTTKDDDFVDRMFIANTHDYILCFSNRGRVYWLKVYNVPQGQRNARGKPIVNLVPLIDNEQVTAILPVKEFSEGRYVFMATAMGTVKKTSLADFSRPRPSGIIAVDLADGDRLIGVALTDGTHDVMLFSSGGKAVRFDENDVRPMGRNGARRARHDARPRAAGDLDARRRRRGAVGAGGDRKRLRQADADRRIHAARPRNQGHDRDPAIESATATGRRRRQLVRPEDDEVVLISTGGVLIRMGVKSIREMSRSTQGVTLINLDDGEKLAGLERVVEARRRSRGRERVIGCGR